jgi:hypothetical protein
MVRVAFVRHGGWRILDFETSGRKESLHRNSRVFRRGAPLA